MTDYVQLLSQLGGLMEGETDLVANAANCTALLNQHLKDINWVGFYFLQGDELVVGPFQGQPACVRIALDHGVCGAAVTQAGTQRVPDVQAFPGHIACDIRSRSELVVPLRFGAQIVGVLDIDSPTIDRFSAADAAGIEQVVAEFCRRQFS
jgi:L-methionine (R)-S-oxide reductase